MSGTGRPFHDVIVGLTPRQWGGGEVKGFHDETDGVDDVHGDGRYFANSRYTKSLDGDGNLDGFVNEDVIHDGSVRLDPLVSRFGGVSDDDGFDREVVVGTATAGGSLRRNNQIHGKGLHQKQHNNGEGHHSAHGHQQPAHYDGA